MNREPDTEKLLRTENEGLRDVICALRKQLAERIEECFNQSTQIQNLRIELTKISMKYDLQTVQRISLEKSLAHSDQLVQVYRTSLERNLPDESPPLDCVRSDCGVPGAAAPGVLDATPGLSDPIAIYTSRSLQELRDYCRSTQAGQWQQVEGRTPVSDVGQDVRGKPSPNDGGCDAGCPGAPEAGV